MLGHQITENSHFALMAYIFLFRYTFLGTWILDPFGYRYRLCQKKNNTLKKVHQLCTKLMSNLSIFPHSSMVRDSIETYNQFGCHFNFDGNICTRTISCQKHTCMKMNRQKSCRSDLLVVSVLQELLGFYRFHIGPNVIYFQNCMNFKHIFLI